MHFQSHLLDGNLVRSVWMSFPSQLSAAFVSVSVWVLAGNPRKGITVLQSNFFFFLFCFFVVFVVCVCVNWNSCYTSPCTSVKIVNPFVLTYICLHRYIHVYPSAPLWLGPVQGSMAFWAGCAVDFDFNTEWWGKRRLCQIVASGAAEKRSGHSTINQAIFLNEHSICTVLWLNTLVTVSGKQSDQLVIRSTERGRRGRGWSQEREEGTVIEAPEA